MPFETVLQANLTTIADDIAQTGSEVLVLPVDMSDERATFELIDRANTHWGRLDILIDSAGIADAGSVETVAIDLDKPRSGLSDDVAVAAVVMLAPEAGLNGLSYAQDLGTPYCESICRHWGSGYPL
jgi:NAD(P)-dependent dehydrogenase (short-subunit alcohol dehydrogenase family)